MSDSHQHEPGMDEILASIRRIIAEDSPAGERHAGPTFDDEPLVLTRRVHLAPPAPETTELHQVSQPAPVFAHIPAEPDDPQLEADAHPAAEQPAATPEPAHADPITHVLDTHNSEPAEPAAEAPAAPAAAPPVVPAAWSEPETLPEETETVAATKQPASEPAPLVDDATVKGAASSFDKLSDVVRGNSAPPPPIHLPPEGRTLEDMLSDMLRPMLKAWLDENLPAIVEARVDEEVERITRRRVR